MELMCICISEITQRVSNNCDVEVDSNVGRLQCWKRKYVIYLASTCGPQEQKQLNIFWNVTPYSPVDFSPTV
jgi:hypothetical protein